MALDRRLGTPDAPRQLFASTPAQRVALARQQFFEEGVRPSGLVGEAVIQSWMRCSRTHADRQRIVPFDAVTPSRLHATLARNRQLLEVARQELVQMEHALAGTDCRVILTDSEGVVVHVTHQPAAAHQPVLRKTARVGVNIAEHIVGTTAPGIVASTGQACTVDGAEHYFDVLCHMQCAAAPIRDVTGRLAGVLDLTVEARRFGFDAASMVSLYATTIENRLLQAQSRDHLILRFQASPTLLGTPLEALAGIAPDGTIAWLNNAGARLLGRLPEAADERDVEFLLGHDLASLLRLGRREAAQPLRLASGLGVWVQARLKGADGADFRHAVAMPGEPAQFAIERDAHAPAGEAREHADHGDPHAEEATTTLREHSRKLIEETLAAHGGNVSQAARQLNVSRGTLYRRLRGWRDDTAAPSTGL
ncbi:MULTISPECIES: helix-turn-helix domain-containing protein [unclassified Variovorax]|jgi:transcriptional regulator of acetoin/glycerol metabolism|uniref:helix-turn-helix domain-containing protein n=1 Tax=unclassified Variovorax TaxID=663243 RepID=UPI000F7EFAAE|nr:MULTISPECIES: helix-turn-helix domain-containing protein [unclassified Variovorax]RSZ38542.1 Fis family transcriptional regulator [Variovorax sp. 553]RSZ39008.1 Fis family transcriptional regulator [Variovorax sp. 679]